MKKLNRNPEIFETLTLFSSFGKDGTLSLSDDQSNGAFLKKMGTALQKAKENPARLHGLRTQTMFEYIAVSLNQCALIKSEDCGNIYSINTNIKSPDFLIKLKNGTTVFVEVKNYYQKNPLSKYVIKKNYLNGITDYSHLFNAELKLAVYWSRWNIWTLSSTASLKERNEKFELSFEDAIKNNEMAIFGDMHIGTIPPLVLRIHTDPSKPRVVQEGGEVSFAVGHVEILAGGIKVEDNIERHFVVELMLYGQWTESTNAIIKQNELIYFDFIFEPDEATLSQSFCMIGCLSGMITRKYNMLTAPEGVTERIEPIQEPDSFTINLPPILNNHKSCPESCNGELPPNRIGKQLKLWCFKMKV